MTKGLPSFQFFRRKNRENCENHEWGPGFVIVPNSYTRRWGEKPAVIERGETRYCLNMGITFSDGPSCCTRLFMCSVTWPRLRCSHLHTAGVKRVWMSDRRIPKVTKIQIPYLTSERCLGFPRLFHHPKSRSDGLYWPLKTTKMTQLEDINVRKRGRSLHTRSVKPRTWNWRM